MNHRQNDPNHAAAPTVPSRRDILIAGASFVAAPFVSGLTASAQQARPAGTAQAIGGGASEWISFGHDTWENGSAQTTGGANVWTLMSTDDELGYVYLPVSTPSSDFYGGRRHGDGLFGESLVCLDARTGRRIWHFQMVHHGLWDYDLPAAPNLIDVRVNGAVVKLVAQVSQQGFVYVFDRVTSRPMWPIEERPVAQSSMPGEQSSRTQPFPTKPAAFDRQGVTENDVIDFTPELRKEALAVLAKYNHGPLYTPPSREKLTIKATGKVVGEVALPRNATAAPMTYMVKGQQYIVATGGANLPPELTALRLT